MCEVLVTLHPTFPEMHEDKLAKAIEVASATVVYGDECPAPGDSDVVMIKARSSSRCGSYIAANLRLAGDEWPCEDWIEQEDGLLVPFSRFGYIPNPVLKMNIRDNRVNRHFLAMSARFGELIGQSGALDFQKCADFNGAKLYPWVTPFTNTGWVPIEDN